MNLIGPIHSEFLMLPGSHENCHLLPLSLATLIRFRMPQSSLLKAARVLSFFLSQGTLQAICSAEICKLQLFVFYSMAAFLFFCEEMAASEDYIGRTSRPLLSANKKMGGRCLTFRSL